MELLEERIRRDGVVKSEGVLKVDSFLNHQLDIDLFDAMGEEFKRLFADAPITKILTIEASGIGIACVVARHFGVPVVFAKKAQSINLDGEMFTTRIESFTHGRVYDVIVSKKFLNADDHVLIIDDFLTVGIDPEAANDLFAILANREHRAATMIASQTSPGYWAQTLPDRVAADSIVNRLANNARTINLGEVDMRRQRDDQARATTGYWE